MIVELVKNITLNLNSGYLCRSNRTELISRETIEEVKNRVDIIDVISDFVTLKKSGQNYKALSPFANEKTPSFFVVPSKGIFKDFSSGKGGDAFTFVMEHEKLSYVEAIRYLAKKYGVEIKEDRLTDEGIAEQSEREGLYILMNFAKEYYKNILTTHDEGKGIGLSYFRERGFTDRTIEKFELGFALEGWENFSKEAIAKGYNQQLLEKTGLVVKKEDTDGPARTYDRFRGRVIFPVHNISGKVIAFGARMLGKDKNQPKYINSPETDIYHKSDVLYGLFQAKNSIRQQDVCYLVEGYTDVISMHQSDVENVVSSSGTALTENQIKLIHRFTENVTVLFDGDSAGIKAALRGIDMILKGGLNVRVVLFPDGEDPDSYSRKVGTTAFQKFLKEHSQDFVSFKTNLFAAEAAGDPIRKAESIKEVVTSISLIPDPVKRSVYIQETSNQLKISESVLLSELNKILIGDRRKNEKEKLSDSIDAPLPNDRFEDAASVKMDSVSMVYFQERETIRLLLNYADERLDGQSLADFLVNELEEIKFSHPVYEQIYHEFVKANSLKQSLDSNFFLQNENESIRKEVSGLVVNRYHSSPNWSESNIFFSKDNDELEKKALSNILHLKYRIVRKWIEENKELLKERNDEMRESEIVDRQIQLTEMDKQIASQLSLVSGKY